LKAAKQEIEATGSKGFVFPLDVANPEEVEAAAQAVEENLGPIDVWINNAMTSVFSPVKEMNAEEFKRVTEVIYLG
jgi:NAD(P)-dependent dehydrogenase (short-subunit alcohol dehydrogenase family)